MTALLRLIGLLVLILVTGLLPAHIAPAQQAQAARQTLSSGSAHQSAGMVSIKVAMLPYISFAPFYLAQANGYFAKQGLKVEFVNLADQVDVIPALASGQVDVSSGLISAGVLNTIAQGSKIAIVADKGYIAPNACDTYALVARRGLVQAGIARHPAKLRGATANISRATWVEYYAEKALNKVGLKVSDLKLIIVPVPAMISALSQGQVDLIAQNEPWVTLFKKGGNEPILTPPHKLLPNSEAAVTLFGSRLLGANASVGDHFMVAYLQGVHAYNAGKTAHNIAILAKDIKLDPGLLKTMCWPTLRSDGLINVASILAFQKWAIQAKYMSRPLTSAQFWNPTFVDAANKQLDSAAR